MRHQLALLAILAAVPASATMIGPSETVIPATISTFGGFQQIDSVVSSSTGADADTITTSVGTWAGNPFGSNDMTFLVSVSDQTGGVQQIGLDGVFVFFSVDLEQYTSSGATTSVTEVSSDHNEVLTFDDVLIPGVSGENDSALIIINTDATNFSDSTAFLTDGSGTPLPLGFTSFTPQFGILPEPSSLGLVGTGLLAIIASLRRSKSDH